MRSTKERKKITSYLSQAHSLTEQKTLSVQLHMQKESRVTNTDEQKHAGLARQSAYSVTNHEIQNDAGLASQKAQSVANNDIEEHSGLARQGAQSESKNISETSRPS